MGLNMLCMKIWLLEMFSNFLMKICAKIILFFYKKRTILTNVIQMGTRKLNGTPIALGVMDF